MEQVIPLIEQRESIKNQIDALAAQKKEIEERIEGALGAGSHRLGPYMVSCGFHNVTRFDTAKYKSECPEGYRAFSRERQEHFFRVVENKAGE